MEGFEDLTECQVFSVADYDYFLKLAINGKENVVYEFARNDSMLWIIWQ
jgi:hypothetical protein